MTHFSVKNRLTALVLLGLIGMAFLGRSRLEGQMESIDAVFARLRNSEEPSPSQDGIRILGDFSQEWKDDIESTAIIRGHCQIQQGTTTLNSDKMVIWWQTDSSRHRDELTVYMEGNAKIETDGRTRSEVSFIVYLSSKSGAENSIRLRHRKKPDEFDPLFRRAVQRKKKGERFPNSSRFESNLRETQFTPAPNDEISPKLSQIRVQKQPTGSRRVRIFPRSAVSFSVRSFESKASTPPEQVWVLTGGINMIIDGVAEYGTVDLSADRAVIWTEAQSQKDQFQTETTQSRETPFEVYLEGNIVIRQEQRVLTAERAVYDAREDRGLMYDAELKSYLPELKDTVRIRAERIRQISKDSYHAQHAWTSTSKFGKPGYRLQASDIFMETRYNRPLFSPFVFDSQTGAPLVEERSWITSLHNTFLVDSVPLFYLPYVSSPAEDPHIPLRRLTIKQDRIFGFQVKSEWDLFGLLGIEEPKGTSWNLVADHLSERGFGFGTNGKYKGVDFFGLPGRYHGKIQAYSIQDQGRDNLGLLRQELKPETEDRYRLQWNHRQDLPGGAILFGEVGILSDRNFLESFYEREFDNGKDVETLAHLKQTHDNFSWSLLVRPQINDFENTTEWLPKADIYVLSEPLFDGHVNWSTHTSAGFAQIRGSTPPETPLDLWSPLPFFPQAEGGVFMTRHELNAPISLGPLQVAPFVMGEAAYWGDGFQGEAIDRFVGSAGVRGSLMMWKVFPNVQSDLFNLNGLTHKSSIEAEYSITDSSENLANIPQYNEFDDNSQERFRQRFFFLTFGGKLPPIFEPRTYAVRSGVGSTVTAPYHELIDDQHVARLAWRHRLQTKVGPPDRLHIKDWMKLDLEASLFPNADRDNFGEDLGLLTAHYSWKLGDRTSILANAYFDLFENAPELWNLAFVTQRGNRGSLYVAVRQVKAANLNSQILIASFTYSMGPKWAATMGTAFDIRESRNAGQSLTLTRIGADFLIHIGANFDASKGNAGVAVAIEPKFLPTRGSAFALSSLLGSRQ